MAYQRRLENDLRHRCYQCRKGQERNPCIDLSGSGGQVPTTLNDC